MFLPNSELYLTFIPKSKICSIVFSTISFDNLNSGIPYINNPPKNEYFSYIVTSADSFAKKAAHVNPEGPPPYYCYFFTFKIFSYFYIVF